jgi:hypothetical protein
VTYDKTKTLENAGWHELYAALYERVDKCSIAGTRSQLLCLLDQFLRRVIVAQEEMN